MNCPRCGAEIDRFNMRFDVQTLFHCPDGYDIIEHNDGITMFVPRSGKVEESKIAGRANYKLEPCGCPVDRVECVGEGFFKFTGKDNNLKPVEFVGPIKSLNPLAGVN